MVLVALFMSGCGAPVPDGLGLREDGGLAPCPGTPNCVHTGMEHPEGTRRIFLRPTDDPGERWRAVRDVVESMKRTEIVDESPGYLRAEATTILFRFIDDIELTVAPERRARGPVRVPGGAQRSGGEWPKGRTVAPGPGRTWPSS